MAIDQTNWSQFLEPGSELPPDITFHILEEQPGAEGDDSECKTSKVQAHKLLLAGVSPVFRKQFFGPLKTSEDTVDINISLRARGSIGGNDRIFVFHSADRIIIVDDSMEFSGVVTLEFVQEGKGVITINARMVLMSFECRRR